MTKAEFLGELEARLLRLPEYEREKSMAFYAESIDDRMEDGMPEADAVASLGSLDEIAAEILVDTPLTTLIQTRIKESRENSGNKRLWTILAICGSPFWVPIAIAFAAVLFTLYVCVWVVVFCLIIAVLCFAIGAVAGVLGGLGSMVFRGFVPGLAILGAGLASFGLFLMSLRPAITLCKQFIGLTAVCLRRIKRLFIKERGNEA